MQCTCQIIDYPLPLIKRKTIRTEKVIAHSGKDHFFMQPLYLNTLPVPLHQNPWHNTTYSGTDEDPSLLKIKKTGMKMVKFRNPRRWLQLINAEFS